jgi:hypothetical protein
MATNMDTATDIARNVQEHPTVWAGAVAAVLGALRMARRRKHTACVDIEARRDIAELQQVRQRERRESDRDRTRERVERGREREELVRFQADMCARMTNVETNVASVAEKVEKTNDTVNRIAGALGVE